jgi:hypothetical protein
MLRQAGVADMKRREITMNTDRKKRKKYTESQWEEMIAAYVGGLSGVLAAKVHGCRPCSLYYQLQQRGIPLRDKSQARCDTTRFASPSTEEEAYWLGFLYTDGVFYKTTFGFNLQSRDYNHAVKFADFMKSDKRPVVRRNVCSFNGQMREYVYIGFRSIQVAKNLTACGMIQPKSWAITPWQGPPELMRHFWRGCIDGDGSLHPGTIRPRGRLPYPTWTLRLCGNEYMVRGFADFIEKTCGIARRIEVRPPQKEGWMPLHSVRYSGTVAAQVAPVLYESASVYLDRKYAMYLDLKEYAKTRGLSPR